MVSFGDKLRIGQQWQHRRTGETIVVAQIHRKDREIKCFDGVGFRYIPFRVLSAGYYQVSFTVEELGSE